MQSQGLALPPEPEVGPSAARVSTKESCVDTSGNDPDTSNSDKYGLYFEENPPRLVVNVNLHFIWTLQVVKLWQGKRYNGISHRRP